MSLWDSTDLPPPPGFAHLPDPLAPTKATDMATELTKARREADEAKQEAAVYKLRLETIKQLIGVIVVLSLIFGLGYAVGQNDTIRKFGEKKVEQAPEGKDGQ